MHTFTTRGTCKTCGGKGYLIRARSIGRGEFVREDETCPTCHGDGNGPQPTPPAPAAASRTRRKREMSSQAKAAAMIRKHLKYEYPHTTFRVRSSSFAGGDAVDIAWTDGPTTAEVEAFSNQFQYGDFDGMRDIYEYTNTRDDIPQSKYVHCHREESREAYRAIVANLNTRRGWSLVVDEDVAYNTIASGDDAPDMPYGYARDTIFRTFAKSSMVCPDCKAATLPGDAYCPACGNPQPVSCWMCDTLTPPRVLTSYHGHRICSTCYLTAVELDNAS